MELGPSRRDWVSHSSPEYPGQRQDSCYSSCLALGFDGAVPLGLVEYRQLLAALEPEASFSDCVTAEICQLRPHHLQFDG